MNFVYLKLRAIASAGKGETMQNKQTYKTITNIPTKILNGTSPQEKAVQHLIASLDIDDLTAGDIRLLNKLLKLEGKTKITTRKIKAGSRDTFTVHDCKYSGGSTFLLFEQDKKGNTLGKYDPGEICLELKTAQINSDYRDVSTTTVSLIDPTSIGEIFDGTQKTGETGFQPIYDNQKRRNELDYFAWHKVIKQVQTGTEPNKLANSEFDIFNIQKLIQAFKTARKAPISKYNQEKQNTTATNIIKIILDAKKSGTDKAFSQARIKIKALLNDDHALILDHQNKVIDHETAIKISSAHRYEINKETKDKVSNEQYEAINILKEELTNWKTDYNYPKKKLSVFSKAPFKIDLDSIRGINHLLKTLGNDFQLSPEGGLNADSRNRIINSDGAFYLLLENSKQGQAGKFDQSDLVIKVATDRQSNTTKISLASIAEAHKAFSIKAKTSTKPTVINKVKGAETASKNGLDYIAKAIAKNGKLTAEDVEAINRAADTSEITWNHWRDEGKTNTVFSNDMQKPAIVKLRNGYAGRTLLISIRNDNGKVIIEEANNNKIMISDHVELMNLELIKNKVRSNADLFGRNEGVYGRDPFFEDYYSLVKAIEDTVKNPSKKAELKIQGTYRVETLESIKIHLDLVSKYAQESDKEKAEFKILHTRLEIAKLIFKESDFAEAAANEKDTDDTNSSGFQPEPEPKPMPDRQK